MESLGRKIRKAVRGKVCSGQELALFFRQLSILLNSGVPIVYALETLEEQPDNRDFAELVGQLVARVSHGYTISNAFASFPQVFTPFHVALVSVGEQTGQLGECLAKLADWAENALRLVAKVKSALTYPVIVLASSVAMTLLLMITVLPGFIEMFQRKGAELPLPTRILVFVTELLTSPLTWALLVPLLIGTGLAGRRYLQSEDGPRRIWRALLLLPVVGDLIRLTSNARYAEALGTLLGSGVGIVMALGIAAEASGNPVISGDRRRLIDSIKYGEALSEALKLERMVYHPVLVQMLAVGEETSSLSAMSGRLSAFFEAEIDARVDALSAALEPLLLALVASIVGGILLAAVMPLYGFLNEIGL